MCARIAVLLDSRLVFFGVVAGLPIGGGLAVRLDEARWG
jgi:hypothetical protein